MKFLKSSYNSCTEGYLFSVTTQTVVKDYIDCLFRALKIFKNYDTSAIDSSKAECQIKLNFSQEQLEDLGEHTRRFKKQLPYPNFIFINNEGRSELSGYNPELNTIIFCLPLQCFIDNELLFLYAQMLPVGGLPGNKINFEEIVTHEFTHYLDCLHNPDVYEDLHNKRTAKENRYIKKLIDNGRTDKQIEALLVYEYINYPMEVQAVIQSTIRLITNSFVNEKPTRDLIMGAIKYNSRYLLFSEENKKKVIKEVFVFFREQGTV